MKKHFLTGILVVSLHAVTFAQPTTAGGYYSESQARQARETAEMNRHYESMKNSSPYQFQGTTQPTTPQDLENTLNTVANLFGLKRKDKASPYIPVKPQQTYNPPPMTLSFQQQEIQNASDNMILNYTRGTDKSLSFEEREAAYLLAIKANEEIIQRFGYNEIIREKSYRNGTNIQLALGLFYFDYNNFEKAYKTIPVSYTDKGVADRIAYCRLILGENMNALADYYRLYQDDKIYVSALAYCYFLNNDYDGAIDVIDDYLGSGNISTEYLIRTVINRSVLLLLQNKNDEALKTYNQISKVAIKTRANLIENLAEHLYTYLNADLAKGGLVGASSLFRLDLLKKLLPYDKNIFAKSYSVNMILNRKKVFEKEEADWNKIKGLKLPANKTVDVYEIPGIIDEVDAQYVVGKNRAARLEAASIKKAADDKAKALKQKEEYAKAENEKRLETEKQQLALLAMPFTDKSITGYVFTDWQTATQNMKWTDLNISDAKISRSLNSNQVVYTQSTSANQPFYTGHKIAADKDWVFSVEYTVTGGESCTEGIYLQTKGVKNKGKDVLFWMNPISNAYNFTYSYQGEWAMADNDFGGYGNRSYWKELASYQSGNTYKGDIPTANPAILFSNNIAATNVLSIKKTGNNMELFINYQLIKTIQIYDEIEFLHAITSIGLITSGKHSGTINKVAFAEVDGNGDGERPIDELWKAPDPSKPTLADFKKDILYVLERNSKPVMYIEQTYKTKTIDWYIDDHQMTRSFAIKGAPKGSRKFKDACNIEFEKMMDSLAQKNNWKKEVTSEVRTKKEKKEFNYTCNSMRYLRYTDDKGKQRVWFTNCDEAEDEHYKIVFYYYGGN